MTKLFTSYKICNKNKQSPIGLNIARIEYEYNSMFCDIQQCNMFTQMNKLYMAKSKDFGDDQ